MADNNNFLDIIPEDITGHLVQYLTVPQLTLFKQLCKQFNAIGSQAVFLQPLYNRLYQLDNTLSPALTSANAPLEFKQAFEKIRDRQNAEISFFLKIHRDPNHPLTFSPEKLNLLSSMVNARNIEQLEKADALLNDLNIKIISRCVSAQAGHVLNLSFCLTRLIIIEEHVEYFKNLTTLFCQGNLFTTLNLNDYPKLEVLDCTNNPFLKEIHLLGCSKSLDVKCDHAEGHVNIFCNNYDHYETFKRIFICGMQAAFQNPMMAVPLIGLEVIGIGKELYDTNNAPLPPQLLMDDVEAQDKKEKFLYIEEVQLFEKLKRAESYSQKAEIIQKLGDRYNAQNCLKHTCLYEASMIAHNQVSSVLEKTSNYFLSFIRTEKKEDVQIEQEESLKRKREEGDNDHEPNNQKKHKPGS